MSYSFSKLVLALAFNGFLLIITVFLLTNKTDKIVGKRQWRG